MATASSASSTWRALASASEYTATVRIPIRCAVFITRQAISPRLAIRIFLNIALQRDVAGLAPGVFYLLVRQHRQRAADPAARFVRHDHVVDVATVPRDKGIGELVPI